MLDSGAYSAWRLKQPVDLGSYLQFIHENRDYVGAIVNLDVIPAEFGKIPSAAEVEHSARVGFANWDQMRREGIDSMPVFHQGESLDWLERMLKDGCEYVGISPANDRTTAQKMEWLDEVFGYLCGDTGYPVIKTHGFGVTAMEIMFRYPWYSADSATWFMCPAYGGVIVPFSDDDGYDYTRPPQMITLSKASRSGKVNQASLRPGKHYESMGKAERKYLIEYLDSLDTGFTIEQMQSDYEYRTVASARYYQEMIKHATLPRFRQRQTGLFAQPKAWRTVASSAPWPRMKMIFTMPISEKHNWAIQQTSAPDRLMTYFYLRPEKCGLDLKEYVENGDWNKRPKVKHDSRKTPRRAA